MAESLRMLSELTGVSGNENKIREYILEKINSKADDITVDSIGNIIALKKGKKSGRKIMVITNMDEAGFIVSGVTDSGYLKIKNVGNIDPRVIISKKVVIGKDNIKGIIGMKAIHLQKASERENTVDIADIFVDIGASSKKNALTKVKLGDYVTFDTEYKESDDVIFGKALDRMGCACVIDAMDNECVCDTYFVFSAQKETGARGARVAAHRINPDISLTVGVVESSDMYGVDEKNVTARIGEGAVMDTMDKVSIKNALLMQKIKDHAKENSIKIQEKHSFLGMSIGGAAQTSAEGAVMGGICIPCRYSHTPVCMMNKNDITAASDILKLFLEKIGDIENGIIG